MPIEPVIYYTATCDRCGDDVLDGGDYGAFSDAGTVCDIVRDQYGKVLGDLVCCGQCFREYMETKSEDRREEIEEALENDEADAERLLKYWVETTRTFPIIVFSNAATVLNPYDKTEAWSAFQMNTFCAIAMWPGYDPANQSSAMHKVRMLYSGLASRTKEPEKDRSLMARLHRSFRQQTHELVVETDHLGNGQSYGREIDPGAFTKA
jgi:hypothetical protein